MCTNKLTERNIITQRGARTKGKVFCYRIQQGSKNLPIHKIEFIKLGIVLMTTDERLIMLVRGYEGPFCFFADSPRYVRAQLHAPSREVGHALIQ